MKHIPFLVIIIGLIGVLAFQEVRTDKVVPVQENIDSTGMVKYEFERTLSKYLPSGTRIIHTQLNPNTAFVETPKWKYVLGFKIDQIVMFVAPKDTPDETLLDIEKLRKTYHAMGRFRLVGTKDPRSHGEDLKMLVEQVEKLKVLRDMDIDMRGWENV